MNGGCVLYARLSVTKEESVSIARQLHSCRSYAEARGWEVVGEFIDDGVSATANRPEDRKVGLPFSRQPTSTQSSSGRSIGSLVASLTSSMPTKHSSSGGELAS